MARGRRSGPSRMDLRRQAEAAEARESDAEDEELEDEELEDEEAEEEEGEEELEADDDLEAGDGDDDDEDAPKAKKKKKKVVKKAPAKRRTRAVKDVRQKAVWVVFDNSSKRVGTFGFSEKKQAEKLLKQKIAEKEGGTFYLQLVKEPLEAASKD